MKRITRIFAIAGATVLLLLGIVFTFLHVIHGRTGVPDFIESVRSGKLNTDAVDSIEVFAPQAGSMPFRDGEYARLRKLAEIDAPTEIKRILDCLAKADERFPEMNHPVVTNLCYLRINTNTGWYWIYCDLLDAGRYRGLELKANTLNGTNPNGGGRYFLLAMEDALAAMGMAKSVRQASE